MIVVFLLLVAFYSLLADIVCLLLFFVGFYCWLATVIIGWYCSESLVQFPFILAGIVGFYCGWQLLLLGGTVLSPYLLVFMLLLILLVPCLFFWYPVANVVGILLMVL